MSLISYYGKLFQVSYVAKDLERAMDFARRKLGVDDFTTRDTEFSARFGAEIRDIKLRMAVSNVGTHQFEIIQPVSGAIEVYTDGIDYARSELTFHHIGIAITGDFSNWEKLAMEVRASGDDFAVLCPPSPDPKLMACYGYVDTRPSFGHYTEYLWWAPEVASNPVFPQLS